MFAVFRYDNRYEIFALVCKAIEGRCYLKTGLGPMQLCIKGKNMSQKFELPSYGNINAEEMAAKIGLNARHIPILVQSFIDESTEIIVSLEAAIEKKDYAEIGNAAHSIKGSAGNLKFDEMYELAKEVELSAKAAKEDYPYLAACASLKNAILSIKL